MTINKKIMSALGAGVLATFAMLPTARAELVYEPEVSPNAPMDVRADDRAATRQALGASERAQVTVQASRVAPVVAPAQPVLVPVQVQPQLQIAAPQQAVQEAPVTDVQSLSKTELMRRERTRTELKNEDLLQERLEELRMRDENRRTGQLLGNGQAAGVAAEVAPVQGMAPQSQMVTSPVTDHPGEEAVAPIPSAVQAQQYASPNSAYTPAAQAQMAASSQVNMALPNSDESNKTSFYIAPRGGVSSMSTNGPFDVKGKFALGVAAGTVISDNLAFELGYTYSEYGISYAYQQNYMGQNFETYTLKQSTIDANLKLYFLGPEAKLRPFVSGGFGYAMASTNYSQNLQNSWGVANYQNIYPDYKTNSYLGTIGAGLDMKVNKAISIGAAFKYYTVLSSTQDNQLAYGNYNNPGAVMLVGAQSPAALPAASLSQTGFYTMTVGLNFAF